MITLIMFLSYLYVGWTVVSLIVISYGILQTVQRHYLGQFGDI